MDWSWLFEKPTNTFLIALALVAVTFPPCLEALGQLREIADKPVLKARFADAVHMTKVAVTVVVTFAGISSVGHIGSPLFLMMIAIILGTPFIVFAMRLPGRRGEDADTVKKHHAEVARRNAVDELIASAGRSGRWRLFKWPKKEAAIPCPVCGQ